MVIQFQCLHCHQPIEIDDEVGGRPAKCPYCQSIIIAPIRSTLGEQDFRSSPPTDPPPFPPVPTRPRGLPATGGHPRLATAGLIFSLLSLTLFWGWNLIVSWVLRGIGPNATAEEIQRAYWEAWNQPDLLASLLLGCGVALLSLACWITGLVMCIVSLVRHPERPKTLARIGLLFIANLPITLLLNLIMGR